MTAGVAGPMLPAPRRCLICAECGRAVPYGTEEVVRYAGDGWPVCCGEVMSLEEVGRHPWLVLAAS